MKTLKQDIQDLLQDDATLQGLLGDPSAEPKKIYYGWPTTELPIPHVSFILGASTGDNGFENHLLVDEVDVRVSAWSKDSVYEDAIDRVIGILHGQSLNKNFHMIRDAVTEDRFDPDAHAWGRTVTFRCRLRRALVA